MAYKDKEKRKEYMKEYMKNYYQENREFKLEYQKEYQQQNKDKLVEYKREHCKNHRKTPQGRKSKRISTWRLYGLICDDIDNLYEHFLNTNECDNCGIELIEGNRGSNHKCMDHNHKTGEFRNILCHSCNIIRSKYEPD